MRLKINLIEFNTRKNKVAMTVDELKRLAKLAKIGITTKDMFWNNKVNVFLNAAWDDGYVVSYSEELSTLEELMRLGEDD